MRKRFGVYIFILIISMCGVCTDGAAAQKTNEYLSKTGYDYKILTYELEGYIRQASMQKNKMKRAYAAYVKLGDRSSLETYKEAELSYHISSFYETYGKRWLNEKWNKKEGSLLIEVSAYQLCCKETVYRKAELREWKCKLREAGKKQKKGIITRLEWKETKKKAENAGFQYREQKKNRRLQNKRIEKKTGKKKVSDLRVSLKRSPTKWFMRWKKQKIGYCQLENEVQAYKKYQEEFRREIPDQCDIYWYAENRIRLLKLEQEQYNRGIKERIRNLCRECRIYQKNKDAKEKEIRLAKKKLAIIKLLKEKGEAVQSQILEQKTEIVRLEYEKATYQYEIEKRYIELTYGMEEEA